MVRCTGGEIQVERDGEAQSRTKSLGRERPARPTMSRHGNNAFPVDVDFIKADDTSSDDASDEEDSSPSGSDDNADEAEFEPVAE